MLVVYSCCIVCVIFLFTGLTVSYAESLARRRIRKQRDIDAEETVDFSDIFYSPSEMEERLSFSNSKITNLDDYFANEDDGQYPFYPLKEITDYFDMYPVMKSYFKSIRPQIKLRGNWQSDSMQDDEWNDDDEEDGRLCNLRSYYYKPQSLPNRRGEHKIIINHFKYEQLVKTERCIGRNSSDRCLTISFKNPKYKNFTSSCGHNYRTWKLAVFNNDTKKMEYDLFDIPSCCTCRVSSAAS